MRQDGLEAFFFVGSLKDQRVRVPCRLFFIGAYSNLACEIGLTSLALALAPLSLLSPVSGLTIVFGAIFAWVGLCGNKKETVTPGARAREIRTHAFRCATAEPIGVLAVELCALLVTCVGVGVAARFGPSGEGMPDLWDTSWRLVGWYAPRSLRPSAPRPLMGFAASATCIVRWQAAPDLRHHGLVAVARLAGHSDL